MPDDRFGSTLAENLKLAIENARLRQLLETHKIDSNLPATRPEIQLPVSRCLPTPAELESVCHPESKAAKVALFRSCFAAGRMCTRFGFVPGLLASGVMRQMVKRIGMPPQAK